VVVAVVLAALGRSRASTAAPVFACLASVVRWGSSSLGAIAGAQAVLGPAGWTGDIAAVASAWCTAVALVAGAPAGPALLALPFGVAAADVVAGPAPGGALAVRVLATAVAAALALAVSARLRSAGWARALDTGCVLAGALALLLAGIAR